MHGNAKKVMLSVFSVLVVLAMVSGATFAWFTDAGFADINFEAGVLDISVSDEMGGMAPLKFDNLRPLTLEQFQAELGPDLTNVNQDGFDPAPNYFCKVVIANEGTLPARLKLTVQSIAVPEGCEVLNMQTDGISVWQDGTVDCHNELEDVLKIYVYEEDADGDWTFVEDVNLNAKTKEDGEASEFFPSEHLGAKEERAYVIAAHLPEDVGNTYQAKHFHGALFVSAVQADDGTGWPVLPDDGSELDPDQQQVSIPISFEDKDTGDEVGATTLAVSKSSFAEGVYNVTTEMVKAPKGYRFDPAEQNGDSTLTESTASKVTFTVVADEATPDEVEITVNFEAAGVNVGSTKVTVAKADFVENVYNVTTEMVSAPQNYHFDPTSQTQPSTLTGDSASAVTFTVAADAASTYEYTVEYKVDETVIKTDTGSGPAGEFTYTPDSVIAYNGKNYEPKAASYRFTISATEANEFVVPCEEVLVSGDGSSWEQAIVINTPEELNAVRNGLDKYYILNKDIDLSGYANWTPIGNTAWASGWFTGGLDGNGRTVSNVTSTIASATSGTNYATYNGLFGCAYGAELKNITIINANINTNFNNTQAYTGILAGSSYNTTITNVHTSGSVTSKSSGTGGVVGSTWGSSTGSSNSGSISNCSSTAEISTSAGQAGGIVGNCNRPVSGCWFNGSVSNTYSGTAGGIVGQMSSSLSNCWSAGSVEGKQGQSNGVGGLVGHLNGGTLSNCFTVAKVNALNTFNTTAAANRTAQPAVGSATTAANWNSVYFQTGNFYVNNVLNTSWDNYSSGSYLFCFKKDAGEMRTAATFASWEAAVWKIEDGKLPELIANPTVG